MQVHACCQWGLGVYRHCGVWVHVSQVLGFRGAFLGAVLLHVCRQQEASEKSSCDNLSWGWQPTEVLGHSAQEGAHVPVALLHATSGKTDRSAPLRLGQPVTAGLLYRIMPQLLG